MSRGSEEEDRGHGGSGRMPPLSFSGRKIGEEGLIIDSCWGGKSLFWDRFTSFLDRETFKYYFGICLRMVSNSSSKRTILNEKDSMEIAFYKKEISSSIAQLGKDILLAGYLFGSTLKPYKLKGDLDIGLLLEEDALKDGTLNIQNHFYLGLRNSLERQDIDVVILNRASLLLRYAVIKEGVLVYEKDRNRRIEFEVRTMLEYFDFSHVRRMFWQDTLERLRDGRFAKPDR